ncbi:CocE/NonD family hydrolase [Komagataeibacter sp. FNDCF1]|uniref:CocE/NonD family hydrolase n=1 Tax=Komagataeibacter sp. FNDCF1 TaxID=2878681 RepID=UPI001E5865B8|nr:CocE/NonD family hydrolase [Komagataeibacter sp. FNDCF1]MCE2565139.1 CocE/NonD family hydrolase [Komagataeibacter sp. FNDCF1]
MATTVEEHIWITMRDGCRLGARIWLPDDAADHPVPAILEYIPYRKRDGTRDRDEPMHSYFAAYGYAAVRVDMRGSGESDGHLADEYLGQEQDDALEVIEWIAARPWCSGRVGMMGKSWGGFNSLQVAARRPPALKAIITVYSTDNRFTDDIHYMGGCLLNDNLWWGSIMMMFQSRPPDPAIVGADWRRIWLERMRTLPFFPAIWMRHQSYDAYWQHGSVCTDYGSITCPVLAVGGWADSYTNTVPRLLASLSVPTRGIIGPWGHIYPQDGVPGPAIGFLQEALRWWDQWLKDTDTGVMDDPPLRAWLEDPIPPAATRPVSAGRWVGVNPDALDAQVLSIRSDGHLGAPDVAGEQVWRIRSPHSQGRTAGEWMGVGCKGEMPVDQRPDDGESLVFETLPLESGYRVLGQPELRLALAADAPVAQIVVRLSDVLPDGQVERVSYQVFNLTHRNGHEHPEALVPGEWYDVAISLKACGHRFPAGHRIRIAIGTCYWPLIWPAPTAVTLSVRSGGQLRLPCLPDGDMPEVVFPPPAHGPATPVTQLAPGSLQRFSQQDYVNDVMTYVTDAAGGVFGTGVVRFDETDTTVSHDMRRELSIRDDDPLSARYVLTQSYELERPGSHVKLRLRTEMTSDTEHFHIASTLEASEKDENVLTQEWAESIPRNLL